MIRNRSFILLVLIFGIFANSCIQGMEALVAADSKKVAFSFDLDDIISGKEKAGFSDFAPLVWMFWNCPMLATAALPHNQQAITNHAQKLIDEYKYNGSTNIIRGVIQYLKDNQYGDVSSYEREINKRTQKPFPVLRMIANIKALKDLGYPVFGATNQDCEQYEVYREHLKSEHKIDLKDLFEGVVTTRVYHHDRSEGHGLVYKPREDDHIYVLHKKEHVKPSSEYFQGVAQVIRSLNPEVGQIVHTDDKLDNNKGAELAGFNSIHFKLAGETVRKTSPEDLQQTVDDWEQELASTYGIPLKK